MTMHFLATTAVVCATVLFTVQGAPTGTNVIEGTFVHVADDYDFIRPRREIFIFTDDGDEIELDFEEEDDGVPAEAMETPSTGDKAQVKCKKITGNGKSDKKCKVSKGSFKKTKKNNDHDDGDRARRNHYGGIQGMTLGSRKVILILQQFPDGYQVTQADIDTAVGAQWTNSDSAHNRFLGCSNDQMGFPRNADVDTFVATLTSLKSSYESTCSQYGTWANEAWANVYSQASGSVTSNTNFVFVMPKEAISGCSIGRGHLCSNGCGTSYSTSSAFPKVWMRYDYRAREDTYAHELGHNIGMHHSGKRGGNEYADTSDTMGYASNAAKCFNGPHYLYMGWLGSDHVTHDPSTSGSQTFSLRSLSDAHKGQGGNSAGNPYLIIVPRSDSTENYYIEFRVAAGWDSGIGSYAPKVGIVSAGASNAITRREPTDLIAGATFENSAANIKVTVNSISGTIASVTVSQILTTTTVTATTTTATVTTVTATTATTVTVITTTVTTVTTVTTQTPVCSTNAECSDGNVCNGEEICDAQGQCQSGTPLNCNDGIACTVDTCDAVAGCQNTADDSICDTDGLACTLDVCNVASGGCESSEDPNNQCCANCDCAQQNLCTAAPECNWNAGPTCSTVPFDSCTSVGCTESTCNVQLSCQEFNNDPTTCTSTPGCSTATCSQFSSGGGACKAQAGCSWSGGICSGTLQNAQCAGTYTTQEPCCSGTSSGFCNAVDATTAPPVTTTQIPCLASGQGLGCNSQTNCCSGQCSGGKPSSRTCL